MAPALELGSRPGDAVIGFLASRHLMRGRTRTALCVLGLSISTALLYDMALLATGLRASLAQVLDQIGYELRILPTGGLPFSSEAVLPAGRVLARELEAVEGVARVVPLWATTLYLERPGGERDVRPVASLALGLDPDARTIYQVEQGAQLSGGLAMIVNRLVADTLGVMVGDTLLASAGLDAASGRAARPVRAIVSGIAAFRMDLRQQRTVSLTLEDLQRVAGREAEDPASFLLAKLEPGADAAAVVRAMRDRHGELDVYSVAELLTQVRGQLSYFQQFSLVLGTVSLIVTFLLILTLLALSVSERQGEIAILRAVGVPSARVAGWFLLEGFVLTCLALLPGLALGTLASWTLDGILKSSPGIPPELSFFVPTPGAVLRTVLLVVVTGTLAGVYPAWLAARTNVVATLHREAI